MEIACDSENVVTKVSVIQAIRDSLKHEPNIQSENIFLIFTFSCNYLLKER
jgi:hypothetical protein